ncbi:MAG: hypothetical protein SO007_03825 [Candidatus Enteromonas sp.]|nr:hypothetical protein [Candidatus Enteromonas sp.]
MSKENIELQQITLKFDGDVIGQLQEIGKGILTNYIIKLGSDKKYLIPVWIEAYCYKKDCFEDEACDGARRKKGNSQYFGENEEHWGKTFTNLHFSYCPKDIKSEFWKRGRVDIVPKHDKSFALSYLLKLAILVEGNNKPELKIQSEIAKLLTDYDANKCVKLLSVKNEEPTVDKTERVGLNKGDYVDKKLSFYRSDLVSPDYEKIVRNRKKGGIQQIGSKKVK